MKTGMESAAGFAVGLGLVLLTGAAEPIREVELSNGETLEAIVIPASECPVVLQTEDLCLEVPLDAIRKLDGQSDVVGALRGDRPPLLDLIEVHEETGGNVISVMEVPRDETGSYGIITPGREDGRVIEVEGLVEKPDPEDAPSQYAAIGRYILEPKVMDILALGKEGAGGEIQLTDALTGLIGGLPFYAVVHDGPRYDCGNKIGLLEANVALALERDDLDGDVRSTLLNLLT